MKSITDECTDAWRDMGLKPKIQIERLQCWANMLEARVKEFDPNYRAFHWGEGFLIPVEGPTRMDWQLER